VASHPVVHIELPASDPKAAGAFYADVFGWSITTDQQYDYTMFKAEGGPGGGFVKLGPAGDTGITYKPGEVLLYIDSDDIEASLRQVEAHGGRVVLRKMEIPGVGWWAVFTDPTGNRMALFTALKPA